MKSRRDTALNAAIYCSNLPWLGLTSVACDDEILNVSSSRIRLQDEAMIDPSSEKLISLKEAAKGLPGRRMGKRPHVSCIYRWTVAGCRGIVLESIQVGGTRCTSLEAISRFFRSLTEAASNGQPVKPKCEGDRVTKAESELDRFGI